MSTLPLVVIGASAGGLDPLKRLVAQFPADLPAAVLVVLHLSPSGPSLLPDILGRAGQLRAVRLDDLEPGAPLVAGHIYVAPPDHHLLVEDGHAGISKGPKENRFRPSVDALFRSAAYLHGSRVIGVVLSGCLDDGTSGLWTIKRLGGTAVVQDPAEADYPPMPEAALAHVEVDHVVPVARMGALITRLVNDLGPQEVEMSEEERRRLGVEVGIAAGGNALELGSLDLGSPTHLTCPDCGGTLVEVREGPITRFRCHTGHGFTASGLLSEVTGTVEEYLYKTLRSMEETLLLLSVLARRSADLGDPALAGLLQDQTRELEARAQAVREAAQHNRRLDLQRLTGRGAREVQGD